MMRCARLTRVPRSPGILQPGESLRDRIALLYPWYIIWLS